MNPTDNIQGYSALPKHIGVFPELGLFRRFAPHWAKKVFDDTSRFTACLDKVNTQLENLTELDGQTILDCPWWIAKKESLGKEDRFEPLWTAWEAYDKSLMNYGQTLWLSQQIMQFPHQNAFHTRDIASFKQPHFKPVFAGGKFMPTGEPASVYQKASEYTDTCAWRSLPRMDFLTMRFTYSSKWIEHHIIRPFRRSGKRKGGDTQTGLPTRMHFDRIVGIFDMVSCLLASGLLTITVWVLSIVHPMKTRIAIVGGVGPLFALLVKLMAGNPTRGEVFGATAGFYAVAVVFLSSTNVGCTYH